jgi:hypothetical protein
VSWFHFGSRSNGCRRYLRQREYPHPPPPSTNNTTRTINIVVISYLVSIQCSADVGPKLILHQKAVTMAARWAPAAIFDRTRSDDYGWSRGFHCYLYRIGRRNLACQIVVDPHETHAPLIAITRQFMPSFPWCHDSRTVPAGIATAPTEIRESTFSRNTSHAIAISTCIALGSTQLVPDMVNMARCQSSRKLTHPGCAL